MKREDGCRNSFYIGIDVKMLSPEQKDPAPEFSQDDLIRVLQEVFSVDPVSGFPRGDIQYWLSKEGNPMVKNWLESNLMQPRSKQTGVDYADDDLIAEMSRHDGETTFDYSNRLMSILQEAQFNEGSK